MPCQILFEAWVWSVSYSTAQSSAALGSTNDQIWGLQAPIGRTKPKNMDGEKLYFISLTSNWNIRDYANTWFSLVAQLCPTLWPHEPQHARPPGPSPTPRVHPNPCPLNRWCHPTISSSVVPFSSCPQSFPASGSFQMSQFFLSGGQSIGAPASTSVLPMKTQDWSPLGWTGWISLQSKGLSRLFSNTTVQKHQFFGAQLCL